MNRHFILAFLALMCANLKVQSTAIDSLKALLATELHDTIRAQALADLTWEYLYDGPDTAELLAKRVYNIADDLTHQDPEAARKVFIKYYKAMGAIHFITGEYNESLIYFKKGLKILKDASGNSSLWRKDEGKNLPTKEKNTVMGFYNNIGLIYESLGQYDRAAGYYENTLRMQHELLDETEGDARLRVEGNLARTLSNLAVLHNSIGNLVKALKYHLQALKIEINLGNKLLIAKSYNGIGNVYYFERDLENCLKYYNLSIDVKRELGDSAGLAATYGNMGSILAEFDFPDKALTYYKAALELNMASDDKAGLAISYNNLGAMWSAKGQDARDAGDETLAVEMLEMALEYQRYSLDMELDMGDKNGIATSYFNVGGVLGQLGEVKEAKTYMEKAISMAKQIGATATLKECHHGMAEFLEENNDYKGALSNFKMYTELNDSLFNEDKSKEIGKLEAEYEFERIEEENARIEEDEIRIANEMVARRNSLQYSGILIFLVVLGGALIGLGKVRVSVRVAEGLIFFTFLLFFEFTLVLLDPYIETYSSGAPAVKLAFNAMLAGLIFPLHSFFETRMKRRISG